MAGEAILAHGVCTTPDTQEPGRVREADWGGTRIKFFPSTEQADLPQCAPPEPTRVPVTSDVSRYAWQVKRVIGTKVCDAQTPITAMYIGGWPEKVIEVPAGSLIPGAGINPP